MAAIGAAPNLRVWKNATGAAVSFSGDQVIRFGLKGSADILGILAPTGRILAIEVKSGNAVQTKEQKNFEAMVSKFGGLYVLARSVDDVLSALSSAAIVL